MDSNSELETQLADTMQKCREQVEASRGELKLTHSKLNISKSQIYNLKRKEARALQIRENAVQRAKDLMKKEQSTLSLLEKGAYSEEI